MSELLLLQNGKTLTNVFRQEFSGPDTHDDVTQSLRQVFWSVSYDEYSERYSEPSQTYKIEIFAKTAAGKRWLFS